MTFWLFPFVDIFWSVSYHDSTIFHKYCDVPFPCVPLLHDGNVLVKLSPHLSLTAPKFEKKNPDVSEGNTILITYCN